MMISVSNQTFQHFLVDFIPEAAEGLFSKHQKEHSFD